MATYFEPSPFVGGSVYNSADVNIPNNILTAMTFDSVEWDTGLATVLAAFFAGGQPTRLTIPTSDYYHVGASSRLQASPGGFTRLWQIIKNGTTPICEWQAPFFNIGGSGVNVSAHPNRAYLFAAGDYIELKILQDSGVGLAARGGAAYADYSTRFWAYRIGAK